MTNRRLAHIERRIEKIKVELAEMGEMRPGSLTRQYKDPKTGSGPYYQLSYTLDMKSRTEYIRKRLAKCIYLGPAGVVMMSSPSTDIPRTQHEFKLIQKRSQPPALV